MKKRVFYFFMVITVSAFIIAACSKDDQKSVSELLMGKWSPEYMKLFQVGGAIDTTTYYTPADYIDFRSDNKVYTYMDGTYDTSTFKLLNDTKIIMDSKDTMTIKSISANSLLISRISGNFTFDIKCKK